MSAAPPDAPDRGAHPWALAGAGSGEVVVIARWLPAPDARATVAALLPELIEASLAEPGCLGYQAVTGDATEPILLIERYAGQAAFDAHRDSSHFQRLVLQRIAPLLASRDVTVATIA